MEAASRPAGAFDIKEAYERVTRSYPGDVGRFYAGGADLALGKGIILDDAIFAQFDVEAATYKTAVGSSYVLTHECDVDDENDRLFNDDLLVCPLLSLEEVVNALAEVLSRDAMVSFLTNLGARNISRVVYLPPVVGRFEYGAVMYLNNITNARAEILKARARRICAVTAYGLRDIEYSIENHLLRPKADRLALDPM